MVDLSLSNQELDKMLEHVKKEVFLGKNAAFLGSVLCSQEFSWDRDARIDTVGTDGLHIYWGIKDFLGCTKDERASTLLHELWHTALLHHIRRGDRCPDIWNVACDYRINNDLRYDGYVVPNTWIVNPELDTNGRMAEEEIYELLMKNALPMPLKPMNDLQGTPTPAEQTQLIAAVVRGVQAAQLAGAGKDLPNSIKETLNTFLEPKIPWRIVLMQWMTDLLDENFTWKRPNRRFQEMYLPSRELEEGRLEHLVYFQDTSGSITRADMDRFNSEVKYVQETLKPKKLTLVQFDTRIRYEREFTEDELFEDLEVHGRGGTSLCPVHNWIEEHKPTAAVIFSDLECPPMAPLSIDVPIIWAVIRTKNPQVPFGKVIQIVD